jgi:hypothetical protein
MNRQEFDNQAEKTSSCEPGLTRKEFIAMVVKRGAIAGAIIAAPKVVDKFLVPPAHAMTSTGHAHLP